MKKIGLIPSIIAIGALAFGSLACGNTNKESNPQTFSVTESSLSLEERNDLMQNIREKFILRALECNEAVTYFSFNDMYYDNPDYLIMVIRENVNINIIGVDETLKYYGEDADFILDHLVDHELRHLCLHRLEDLNLPKSVYYGPGLTVDSITGLTMYLNGKEYNDTTMEEGLVHLLSVLKSQSLRPDLDYHRLSPSYELLSKTMNDLLDMRGIDANALAQQDVLDYEQLRSDIIGIHGEATDDYDAIIRTWVETLEKFSKDPSTYYQGAFQELYELNQQGK